MSFINETDGESNSRVRTGRIVALLCIAWWVVSVGGIILVINTSG